MKWRLANGYCKSLRCHRMELSPRRLLRYSQRGQFHGFTRQYGTRHGLWIARVMRLIARKIERFMKSHRVFSLIVWELEVVGRSRLVRMFCRDLSIVSIRNEREMEHVARYLATFSS